MASKLETVEGSVSAAATDQAAVEGQEPQSGTAGGDGRRRERTIKNLVYLGKRLMTYVFIGFVSIVLNWVV